MAIITLSNHIQGYTIMSLALAMMVQHANQLNAQNPARITTDLLPKEQAEKMTAVEITEYYLRQIAQKHGIEIEMRVQPYEKSKIWVEGEVVNTANNKRFSFVRDKGFSDETYMVSKPDDNGFTYCYSSFTGIAYAGMSYIV